MESQCIKSWLIRCLEFVTAIQNELVGMIAPSMDELVNGVTLDQDYIEVYLDNVK